MSKRVLAGFLLLVVLLISGLPVAAQWGPQPPAPGPEPFIPETVMYINGVIYDLASNRGVAPGAVVELYRDKGDGDELVSSKTTVSERGDFQFSVSAVDAYYKIMLTNLPPSTVGVEVRLGNYSDGALVKKLDPTDPTQWYWEFHPSELPYGICADGYANVVVPCYRLEQLTFVVMDSFTPQAQPASWVYVNGRVINYLTGSGVEGCGIRVGKMWWDPDRNVGDPNIIVKGPFSAVSGPKGWWGVGLPSEMGMYKVWIQKCNGVALPVMSPEYYTFAITEGPASAWLPWDLTPEAYIYGPFVFAVAPVA